MSSIAECPFCNLGERILLDNKHAFAFLSNPRKMPGHFLVSPKRHVEKPWKLTSEELSAIFDLIRLSSVESYLSLQQAAMYAKITGRF